ncbi:MAG TPA: helix-turn-helix domain-containing protein [Propionibacteriaceae bacterium]|nr:helix-turn-helix domain-containing protein [Propionibacteriaceae bacterium]
MARALELVGERWSLLIIRDALFAHVTRFGDFEHNLGIATNVLSSRLAAFVEAGLMERRVSDDRQSEYVLTEMGRDLGPTMIALTHWGDRWAAPGEPPILYVHDGCGGSCAVQVDCETCGPVAPSQVAVRPGPGMPASYLANRRPRRAAGPDDDAVVRGTSAH